MARNDRTVRLETLKQALAQSRRGVALKTLADRHGWPLRNLYRDVEVLEAAGYAVVREDGRLRIDGSPLAAPAAPTADERLALYLAREQARGWKHTSLGRALDRLWNRLSATAGQTALVPVDAAPWLTTRDWTSIDYGKHRHVVAILERAVRERAAVHVRYQALSTRQITDRVIEPGQLHWDPGLETLYVIAWCRLRGDTRIFAVHRILAATLLDKDRFTPRPETTSAAALKAAFRVWRSRHVETVRVRFAPEIAGEIRERRWLPGQQIEDMSDGAIVVAGQVAGLAEVERWVLGYGGAATVLAPRALQEAVANQLGRAAANYVLLDGAARGPQRARPSRPRVDSLTRTGKAGA